MKTEYPAFILSLYPALQALQAMALAATPPATEQWAGLALALGGKNKYKGVRGSQGKDKDKYQGHTPKKIHTTKLYATAHEAASSRCRYEPLTLYSEPLAWASSAPHHTCSPHGNSGEAASGCSVCLLILSTHP